MAETEQNDTAAETQIELKEEPKPEVEQPPAEVQPEQQTMRSVVLTGHGGYNKIKVEKRAKPKPMQGQVVVKVHACGLNFADLMQRQGLYSSSPKTPYVEGMECSGVVEELGDEVTGIEVGARVCCLASYGMWTEYAAVPATNCFIMPDAMTFEEGAALPVTYLTAHLMLFHCGNLRRRKSVLIHMAAGGVGTAATQLCKTVEGVTIFGTASASKHETIKENGVTHPIDYRTTDYAKELKKISADGVDLILDPLGGGDTKKCYDLLKPMGALVCFGGANYLSESKSVFGAAKTWFQGVSFHPFKLMNENRTVSGFHLGRLFHCTDLVHDSMKDIMRLYNEGAVKPKIDSVFALEEVPKAMQKMHDRLNIGKILLSPMKEPEPVPVEEPKHKKKSGSKTAADQPKKVEEGEAAGEAKVEGQGEAVAAPAAGDEASAEQQPATAAEAPKEGEKKEEEGEKNEEQGEQKEEGEPKKEEGEPKKEEGEPKKEEEEPKKEEEESKKEEPKKEEPTNEDSPL